MQLLLNCGHCHGETDCPHCGGSKRREATAGEATAILRSIERSVQWYGPGMFGWDHRTFHIVFPQRAAVFNAACETISGKPGRYVPR